MSPDDYRAGAGYRRSNAAPGGMTLGMVPRVGQPSALTSADLVDHTLGDFMTEGWGSTAGEKVTPRAVLRNAAVARSVFLIANAIGMLPLQLMRAGDDGTREKAKDHPLYAVLASRPNHWQTAYVFRRLMQHRVLVYGNAYALVIRARGRVSELVPLDIAAVTPKLSNDWTLTYQVRRKSGGTVTYGPEDILHLMGPSEDGVKGLSLVSYAGEVLGLSLAAQRAAGKLFSQGMLAGGMLQTDGKLSAEAIARLREQMKQFEGAEFAGKWMVGEEGIKAQPFGGSAKDSQNLETRQHQVEEVARIFGVPRPFLMMDDTSWGSGIEQLGIYFVQYGLAPHFVCWEQAIERTCLTEAERGTLYAKFNERALLRGSMKDQAEFLARALGSGGGRPWMTQDETRELQELAPVGGDAAVLGTAAGQPKVTIGG